MQRIDPKLLCNWKNQWHNHYNSAEDVHKTANNQQEDI